MKALLPLVIVLACGASPQPSPATYHDDVLGMTVADSDPLFLARYGAGPVVVAVDPGALADRLGLVPGDVPDAGSIRVGRRHVRHHRIGSVRQFVRFYDLVRSTPDARAFGFRFETADGPRTVTFGTAILSTPPPIEEPLP